jgi:hypothetical protein
MVCRTSSNWVLSTSFSYRCLVNETWCSPITSRFCTITLSMLTKTGFFKKSLKVLIQLPRIYDLNKSQIRRWLNYALFSTVIEWCNCVVIESIQCSWYYLLFKTTVHSTCSLPNFFEILFTKIRMQRSSQIL